MTYVPNDPDVTGIYDRRPWYTHGKAFYVEKYHLGSGVGHDGHRVPQGAVLAALPHSCDEWIIGGAEEVQALITDLQGMLASGRLVPSLYRRARRDK